MPELEYTASVDAEFLVTPAATSALVVIFGPPAVGKMTVGRELALRTGLKLFHNHHTIELVLQFFPFGTLPFSRLVREFRRRIIEEVAESDLPGLIFTLRVGVRSADRCRDDGGVRRYFLAPSDVAEQIIARFDL